MLKKLGVYDELGAKLVRYDDGTAVMNHLIKGQGREFGFGGITDILLYRDKDLQLVGPLPEETQNYTAYATAMITASHCMGRSRSRRKTMPRTMLINGLIKYPRLACISLEMATA